MRNILAILALILGGTFGSSTSANDLLDTAGSTLKTICPESEVLFWGKSHHPNGAGNLNEENRGLGLRCYHDTSFWGTKLYGEADELRNSQNGRATVIGLGVQKRFFQVGQVSLEGAVGYVRVGYEAPKYDETAYRWVWTTNVDLAYDFKDRRFGTITLNALPVPGQEGQGGGKIWIFFAGWRKSW
jgi:hypothetical protein